ncbi:hypothetical protein GCM10011492_42160 [Flexivirga endophytica]|uniref:Uncharacterized protein n=1 Tax=Flexivirga endophytica TaxID=1849103 RepID=A0A916X1C5_9MICO|nr:hypothetical protein [Flexivirga endophytica]GGB46604.1 hypothetical protein GCM10011492_42160 [Flexivirga endophytica]GHB70293.1 hypothetical protein GCM10008112_43500 [Flexivirga endophytica]
MQTVNDLRRPPAVTGTPLGAGAIAAAASVPALIAVLPLTLGSTWYVAADENREFLTTGRAIWGFVLFSAGVLPFVAFVIALITARASGSRWPAALKLAAIWIAALGLIACGAAMLGGGGF